MSILYLHILLGGDGKEYLNDLHALNIGILYILYLLEYSLNFFFF